MLRCCEGHSQKGATELMSVTLSNAKGLLYRRVRGPSRCCSETTRSLIAFGMAHFGFCRSLWFRPSFSQGDKLIIFATHRECTRCCARA